MFCTQLQFCSSLQMFRFKYFQFFGPQTLQKIIYFSTCYTDWLYFQENWIFLLFFPFRDEQPSLQDEKMMFAAHTRESRDKWMFSLNKCCSNDSLECEYHYYFCFLMMFLSSKLISIFLICISPLAYFFSSHMMTILSLLR